jgi:hypothetical protein
MVVMMTIVSKISQEVRYSKKAYQKRNKTYPQTCSRYAKLSYITECNQSWNERKFINNRMWIKLSDTQLNQFNLKLHRNSIDNSENTVFCIILCNY